MRCFVSLYILTRIRYRSVDPLRRTTYTQNVSPVSSLQQMKKRSSESRAPPLKGYLRAKA